MYIVLSLDVKHFFCHSTFHVIHSKVSGKCIHAIQARQTAYRESYKFIISVYSI